MSKGYVTGALGAVVVEGPDAGSFLQGLISQDVEDATADRAVRSFLLGPRGKFRALLWVVRTGDRFWLFTDSVDNLIEDLRRFHIRVNCTVEQFSGPVFDVIGSHPEAAAADGEFQVIAQIPWRGPDRWVVAGIAPESLSLTEISDDQWTRIRIEAGEPLMDRDVDESTIPQESGLVAESVSFTKGCYLGQELVARIDTRGHVNKRLVMLTSGGSMEEGAAIENDEGTVGTVSSVAPTDEGSVALAVLATAAEGTVMVGQIPASVSEIR